MSPTIWGSGHCSTPPLLLPHPHPHSLLLHLPDGCETQPHGPLPLHPALRPSPHGKAPLLQKRGSGGEQSQKGTMKKPGVLLVLQQQQGLALGPGT